MATLNKVFLIGNLTRDPEVRVTPKGTQVGQFGLAVNRSFKDDSGALKEEVTFIDIEAWGKQAELCGKYLKKGSPCMVEGRLKFEQWDDKQSGQKRSKLKVVMENVQFLGSKSASEGSEGAAQDRQAGPARVAGSEAPVNGALQDVDAPF